MTDAWRSKYSLLYSLIHILWYTFNPKRKAILTGDAARGKKVNITLSEIGVPGKTSPYSVLTMPLNYTLKNGDDEKFGYMYGVEGTKVLKPTLTRPRGYFTAWDSLQRQV